MTDVTIRKTIYLRAAPARVWAYLTEPEKLAVWFHRPDKALIEGDYAVYAPDGGEKMMWGRVIVAQPFERLHYTFAIPAFGDSESTVKWTLEDVSAGTRLSLEHSGLPEGGDAFGLILALDEGWEKHLARMRDDTQVL